MRKRKVFLYMLSSFLRFGDMYGVFPYVSRISAYANKSTVGKEFIRYASAVYRFKRSQAHADFFRRRIEDFARATRSSVIVAIPSSNAGKINSLQMLFGVAIKRIKTVPKAKYNKQEDVIDPRLSCEIKSAIRRRRILLVDDLISTGRTMTAFREWVLASGAASASCLGVGVLSRVADYIPDEFVNGEIVLGGSDEEPKGEAPAFSPAIFAPPPVNAVMDFVKSIDPKGEHAYAADALAYTWKEWMRLRTALGESGGIGGDGRLLPAARRERELYRDLVAGLKEFGGTPASRVAALHEVANAVETVMPWDEVPPMGEELK